MRYLALGAVIALMVAPSAARADATLASRVATSGVWVNSWEYTPPVYVNDGTFCNTTVTNDFFGGSLANVPLPCDHADFVPSAGMDKEAIVLDPIADKTYEFYKMSWNTGDSSWHANGTWGAANSSFDTSWDGIRAWATGGVQASKLSFTDGLITVADLKSGVIDHPVHLLVPRACMTWRYPAKATDNGNANTTNCYEYGTMFKLPESVDTSGLPLVPRLIANAAKTYGLMVSDQTNSSFGFRVENLTHPGSWWAVALGQGNTSVDPYHDEDYQADGYDFFDCHPGHETECYPNEDALFHDFPWADLVEINQHGEFMHDSFTTRPFLNDSFT